MLARGKGVGMLAQRLFSGMQEKKQTTPPPHSEPFHEPEYDPKAPVENEFVVKGREKIVGWWLIGCAGGVLFMILLGGYTRLSHSGLSMVSWHPIQRQLPRDAAEWNKEFENYKNFPEFKIANPNMSLDGFKKIFFVEWAHRVAGNALGGYFLLPLIAFYGLKWIKPKATKRLLALGAIGGIQGLIGWWMVKSGLGPKPEYQQRPRVSTYRLFVHLNTAVLLYSGLLWHAFHLIRPAQELVLTKANYPAVKSVRLGMVMLLHFIALNIMSGALVAGIDAGKVFNTWPLMNGQYILSHRRS
jgi:cytochrome c oxidase assembly protein subunit 15